MKDALYPTRGASSRQLTIPGAELVTDASAELELMRLSQKAWGVISTPGNERTRKAYERHQDNYARWCARMGLSPLPCSAEQLTVYLTHLTEQPNASPSVIQQAASAIASIDKWSRVTPDNPDPVSVLRSMLYVEWRKKWRKRTKAGAVRKAPVFSRADLERVISAMDAPTPGAIGGDTWAMRAARDRAMWLVGIAAATRVSELGAIQVEHVTRVPQGLVVLIPSSKTDQEGAGELLGIEPSTSHHLCPVRAWEAWLQMRGAWSGPAWVPVYRTGQLGGKRLSQRAVQIILQENAKRVGLYITSHSLRRVFATTCATQRKRLDKIMSQARWTRVETAISYMETANLWIDNPTRGLFEGDW